MRQLTGSFKKKKREKQEQAGEYWLEEALFFGEPRPGDIHVLTDQSLAADNAAAQARAAGNRS
eukprot:302641-Rhodomonas_salina.2